MYGENAYEELIEPELPDFVSSTFETLCGEAVPALYPDLTFTEVPNQWWYDGHEVDVVAPTDGSTLLVGEANFTNTVLSYETLAGLENDAEHVDWTPPAGGEPRYEYALFSRSGFTRSVEEAASERDDLEVFGLERVVDALESR